MIDSIDRDILSILIDDASTSKAEIGRRIGLAPAGVSERVRRLEDAGVVRGYEVRLDPKQLGKPLLAFVFVTEAKPSQGFDTPTALSLVTGLEELHKLAGDDCFLLKIRATDTDELNTIIEREINPVESVTHVRTTIALQSLAERPPLAGHRLKRHTRPHTAAPRPRHS
ncbi:MAG: Lrp/AsnC family transcriptional regulator [Actinomycetia bacterium]|nr:Lrp/AsnC family transcriptional regulator [Actinomycetes bacterium]MCP4962366.1 Lrp/AsnC family transcriptional regulator [Actinomycetes bacterium]